MKTLFLTLGACAVLIPSLVVGVAKVADAITSVPLVSVAPSGYLADGSIDRDAVVAISSADGKPLPRSQWDAVLQSGRYEHVPVAAEPAPQIFTSR